MASPASRRSHRPDRHVGYSSPASRGRLHTATARRNFDRSDSCRAPPRDPDTNGAIMSTTTLDALDGITSAAAALVREQLHIFSGDACVTSSFQAEDVVVLHLVRAIAPNISVLFLDTGYHFQATYEYRDRIAADWHLNLHNILPAQTVAEQEAQFGFLNQTAPDRCCGLRKVGPLFAALAPYSLWFTGLRRQQAKTRANLQAVENFTLPTGKQLRKLSPLADWHTREVW